MTGNFSGDPLVYHCSTSKARVFILISISALKTILILPLSTFILHIGYKRWRQQCSFTAASHSDLFTYHLAAMELFWGFGFICYLCGLYTDSFVGIMLGLCAFSVTFYAELFFHLLTCIERYLAVVHPITYRGLRGTRGVRIRNVSIGCVWLLTFVLLAPHKDPTGNDVMKSMLCFLVLSIVVISFCSVSVLCVLIRPGPGEGGGEKERVDQSKQRAFYTLTAISAALWLWFLSVIFTSAVHTSSLLSDDISCLIIGGLGFFNLPCYLVSPMLFLHRAGKLPCGCFHRE